jgi:hypothetical protein
MYGIWVVDEWLTNKKDTIYLFETPDKAEIVRAALDSDVTLPMEVRPCDENGEIYEGKLLKYGQNQND